MASKIKWAGPESLRPTLVKTDRLATHPSNPRRGNLDVIAASLERFGQNEERRARYAANPDRDELNAKRRARYAADPQASEKTRARSVQFRKQNPEYHRDFDRRRAQESLVQRTKREIGCCQRCGYDRYLGALSWHHVDPGSKKLGDMRHRSEEAVAEELRSCVLICENCHREAHAALWDARKLIREEM